MPLQVRTLTCLREIPAERWDELFNSPYPFTQHAFLSALEDHGCVGRSTGWEPCHRLIEDEQGRLLAAMPLYRKRHSYGEFVFDFAWANASRQIGRPYYPKLVCAIPFTPVTGPRIAARNEAARELLIGSLGDSLSESGDSSMHALFLEAGEAAAVHTTGWLQRNDVQFHWFNKGYTDFAGFLAALSHDKRKKILRERRRVTEAGLRFEVRAGDELSESEWAQVYAMYGNTYEERGQAPYLTLDFFLDYGRRTGTPLRVILALEDGARVAVAILFQAGGVLYGRHWGCADKYHSLHFETCYYQGIALCLRENLSRFDAGAQGEHKRARGFDPVLTHSLHRLADPRLHAAVGEYLERERTAVAQQQELLIARSAYRDASSVEGPHAQHGDQASRVGTDSD